MRIFKCDSSHYPLLEAIWERSVRATHTFLDDAAIDRIKELIIPVYFPAVTIFAAEDGGHIVGFVGIGGDVIEMLFVDSKFLRRGYGAALMDYALGLGACRVDVNEQNYGARAFYTRRGFTVVGRDDCDDAGRPYPILHLQLPTSAKGEY